MTMATILPQLIDQAAAQSPEQVAFRFKDQALTYAELCRRASNLAHTLVNLGVKPGDRVGIYLHKSLESAIAIYGIWKAGAAYVPLDPMLPLARLAFIINDCQLEYIISQEAKRKNFQALTSYETSLKGIIGLADQADLPYQLIDWMTVNEQQKSEPPHLAISADDMAYIMYTSGSTGDPKGIIHTHFSGLSYARIAAETYDLNSQDRLANFAPLHFDQSTFDYFSGPLAGATTVIIPEEYTLFPANLSRLIDDEQITIWYSVPFALIQLLQRGVLAERNLRSLRWVLYGGEPFPPKHLRAIMKFLPNARFSNVYGPAEVNQCTYYHFSSLPGDSEEPVPIGQVWAQTEGLVVDEVDNVVADGEIGELLICSPTMMQGYWHRPDLNERAFYRRTGPANKIDVFYRTGDLVRRQPAGHYQFLGRKDRQVKTRGYRVELDEVEAAILAYADVEETAVYPIPNDDGSQQIKADIILKADCQPSKTRLTQHLLQQLPRYAVPTEIDFLTAFPRTSSGKINRRALQAQAIQATQRIVSDE